MDVVGLTFRGKGNIKSEFRFRWADVPPLQYRIYAENVGRIIGGSRAQWAGLSGDPGPTFKLRSQKRRDRPQNTGGRVVKGYLTVGIPAKAGSPHVSISATAQRVPAHFTLSLSASSIHTLPQSQLQ